MEQVAKLPKNLKMFIAISLFALIGGYYYVVALSTDYRWFIYIHAGILFFAGMAVFLKDIKAFLIFVMLFSLALGFGRHIIHYRPPFESVLFSTGIRIDAVEAVLVLCYAHWAVNLAGKTDQIRPITMGGRVGTLFLAWIAYVFVSNLLEASHLDYSVYEVIVYVKGFLLYFYLVNNIKDENELKIVTYGIFAACVVQSLYMILQYATKTSYTISGDWISYIGPEGFRSRGFYGSPDAHATFLAIVFPVFVLAWFVVQDIFKKAAVLSSIIIILTAIIFSKVRIAFASMGLGSIVAIWMAYRKGWLSQGQVISTMIAGIFMTIAVIPLVYERFAYGIYGEDRIPLLVTAFNMFKSNALFGVGANNYNFVVLQYIPPNFLSEWLFTVHSEYLLRLAETGILGFLLYYGFVLLVMYRLFQGSMSDRPLIFMISCGFFAAFIGSFVHRIVSMYHYQQVFALQSVVFALSVIVNTLDKRES